MLQLNKSLGYVRLLSVVARTNTKTDETNHNQKPTHVTYEYRYFIITQQHDNKQTAHHHCNTTTNDKPREKETP